MNEQSQSQSQSIGKFPRALEVAKEIDLKFEMARYSSSADEYEAVLVETFENAKKRLKSLHNAKSAQARWTKPREKQSKARQICASSEKSELMLEQATETRENENFTKWWERYPKKRRVNKIACAKKFAHLKPDEQLMAVKQIIEATTGETDWTKEDGKFCPMTTTYLNQRRFEQEVKAISAESKQLGQMIVRDDRSIKLL